MANTIKRGQHFESEHQKYTAWITVDKDRNVVYIPEELSEFSYLPDEACTAVIIKNDDDPNDYYMIECGEYENMSVSHHFKTSFVTKETDNFDMMDEMDGKELNVVAFHERDNILQFYFGNAEDKDSFSNEIPCNVPLAAFILNGSVFAEFIERSSCNYLGKNEFPGIGLEYHDYIPEE